MNYKEHETKTKENVFMQKENGEKDLYTVLFRLNKTKVNPSRNYTELNRMKTNILFSAGGAKSKVNCQRVFFHQKLQMKN